MQYCNYACRSVYLRCDQCRGGSYSFTARATGNLGIVTTSSAVAVTIVANTPPTVSIAAPANNATFVAPANIPITAKAADTDGTVAKVDFFEGANLLGTVTTAPYTFNFNNVPPGAYTLFAKATDNLGATTTSAAVNVTVNPNQPPSVTLTNPTNNESFTAPAMITLTATASDTDGTITQVEFLSGTNVVATLTSPPYTFNLTNIGAGSYTLAARATDDKGAQTTSAAVNVTVTAPSATIFYIYTDQLNTPRAITNEAATTVWRWDNNDPFGNNAPNEDPDGDGNKFTCNLRFPGQYFDRETGTHYNYYRDYDPNIGRYVESDPIGLRGGMNLYLYVRANPLSSRDLRGLFSPAIHLGLSRSELNNAGFPPSISDNVANLAWQIDFAPDSQDASNAAWHGMCTCGIGPGAGIPAINRYVDEQLRECSFEGLARALHAAQDTAAGGHRGCQQWCGTMTFGHAFSDQYPSVSELEEARQNSRDVIRRYNQICRPNTCGPK